MPQNSITPELKAQAVNLGGMMAHTEKVMQRFNSEVVGIPNKSEAVHYTQQEADEHNALLEGALGSTDPLTAEQAESYNTATPGAEKTAGDTLTAEEASAYNATLDGAVTTADVKTPAVPQKVKEYVDGNTVSDVTFDPSSGELRRTKNGTTSKVCDVVTSGFKMEYSSSTGIKSLTPVGGATGAFNDSTGIKAIAF